MSIYTYNNLEIKKFEINGEDFLNKTIMLYGDSSSGKSTIIKDILYHLKPHIPNILVICPTNDLNESYKGIVPNSLIHKEVSEKLIKSIFERQKKVVSLFNMCNNIDNLTDIITKYLNDENKIDSINNAYDKINDKIINDSKMKPDEKRKYLDDLQKKHIINILKYYKRLISNNRNGLLKMDLNEREKKIVNYINVNPNLLLILDDCGSNSSKWNKYTEIQELFYNGRHHRITSMYALQDDILMTNSSLRKNAFINIFTTYKCAMSFFERSSNSFSKREKKDNLEIVERIFQADDSYANRFRKFIYMKNNEYKNYHYTAELREDFLFGNKYLLEYCDKIKKTDNNYDPNDFKDFF